MTSPVLHLPGMSKTGRLDSSFRFPFQSPNDNARSGTEMPCSLATRLDHWDRSLIVNKRFLLGHGVHILRQLSRILS